MKHWYTHGKLRQTLANLCKLMQTMLANYGKPKQTLENSGILKQTLVNFDKPRQIQISFFKSKHYQANFGNVSKLLQSMVADSEKLWQTLANYRML